MFKALTYGLLSSLFFSSTFILNREMATASYAWQWTAALRFLIMLPLLALLLSRNQAYRPVLQSVRANLSSWVLWSCVGFGFYVPLCYAASFGPAWLIAGALQITIPAGALLTPLFLAPSVVNGELRQVRHKIPIKLLLTALLIMLGVGLMLVHEATSVSFLTVLAIVLPVGVAAFAYPLGSRKILFKHGHNLNTLQRVFGMTLCSMPVWLCLAGFELGQNQLPPLEQIFQSSIVALFSGIIATLLLFEAANLVKHNLSQLAVIEATQAGEVVFTLLGGVLFFHDGVPDLFACLGIALVLIGMVINSLVVRK
ncbi:MAG: multidrug resistance efflux transporter family protein [Burkholderiales bacterium]|nr:multidrug resistance efflux transporter family protein [Burkholderiales bacterium]